MDRWPLRCEKIQRLWLVRKRGRRQCVGLLDLPTQISTLKKKGSCYCRARIYALYSNLSGQSETYFIFYSLFQGQWESGFSQKPVGTVISNSVLIDRHGEMMHLIGGEVFKIDNVWAHFFTQIGFCKNFDRLTRRFSMHQNGAFWSLKNDCTRLRHHRMSWIVSKVRASIFLS